MLIPLLRQLGRRDVTSQFTLGNQRSELAQPPCEEVGLCGIDFHENQRNKYAMMQIIMLDSRISIDSS